MSALSAVQVTELKVYAVTPFRFWLKLKCNQETEYRQYHSTESKHDANKQHLYLLRFQSRTA